LQVFYLSQVLPMFVAIFPQCLLGYIGIPPKVLLWDCILVCLHIVDARQCLEWTQNNISWRG
jgi:hypothetical protein